MSWLKSSLESKINPRCFWASADCILLWASYEIQKSVGGTSILLGAVENDFQLVTQEESWEIACNL